MRLYDRIAAALVWIAAFCYAAGVFFSITLLFPKIFPPTDPVATGIVTIQRYAKIKDYVSLALFLLLVPALTVWFERILGRLTRRDIRTTVALTVPLMLAPLFHVTTGKVGWILVLPAALAFAGVTALRSGRLPRPELYPYHALIFCEGVGWLMFRYLVRGHRIAHYPTLALELVFVAAFLALFWGVAILAARIAHIAFGANDAFRRIASGAIPFVALPIVPLVWVPTTRPVMVIVVTVIISALLIVKAPPLNARTARTLAAWVFLPLLIYIFSYASTAHYSQHFDLFHRGESLGPASDYLRGKAPYRDVFVLHGLLEDGMLDAWLMQLFGRDVDVALTRQVVLGGFLAVFLWVLGMVVFDSIPLALIVIGMSAWTTAENNRTFFQVAAVAFLLIALQRRKPLAAFISGAFAGVALFFSFDIGLYTIAGIALTIAAMTLVARRCASEPIAAALPPHSKVLAWSVAGFFAGTAPFVVYLVSRGVFGDFLSTSFATIPAIIDAVWSLPFPDLVSQFRRDPNLQKLAEFVLQEKFRLILSPLTIAVAAVYLLQRVIRGRFERLDQALLVLTIFAAIAQRSAFGRPDFRHQYFAAFLVGPMLVILGLLAARSVREIWRGGDQGARAFVSAIVLAALPLIAVVFWIPDLVNARIEDLMNYQRRVLRVQRDGAAEEILLRIRYVTEEIRRMTRRREPIFDFSNQPAFYFFADRMNPTRFYQVPIASPRQFQAEVIAALEKSRPKVVLRTSPERFDEFDGIPNSVRAQAVAAYLDDAYRFHAKVWGIEIWRRDPAAKAASVEAYLRRIHLPAKDSIAADERARMVFPAVGSTPGANDSYWVSDLTLHNPFRESMAMSLRFIGPNARVDRRLTLAPRQTMRWPDVVKTFFGADGIGTLWIQHRQSRAPVAIVKTADVAHDARASVEFPLTDRDAVTANTENSELIVVGVPAVTTAGRRVNVGIVNTGRIPASFRISVRTRAGREIGRTVESGIPEDEVWTVPNIERELGVTLDETTTLRFTAIAGTGVGYATVIEPNGDSEFIAAHPAQGQ